jgi:hypothetical protein
LFLNTCRQTRELYIVRHGRGASGGFEPHAASPRATLRMQAQGLSDSPDQGKSRSDFLPSSTNVFTKTASGGFFSSTLTGGGNRTLVRGASGVSSRERLCACRRKTSPIRLDKEIAQRFFCLPPPTHLWLCGVDQEQPYCDTSFSVCRLSVIDIHWICQRPRSQQ